MAASSLTEEDFQTIREGIVSDLVSQLNASGSLIDRLVTSLSKGLVDKLVINKASAPITQEQTKTTETKQPEVQKQAMAPLMSKATEQAIAKIPALASIMVEVAKNTKAKQEAKQAMAPLMSKATEQAIAKIPVLASIMVEVAKNVKSFTFDTFFAKYPTFISQFRTAAQRDFFKKAEQTQISEPEREKKEEADKEKQAVTPPKSLLEKQDAKDQKVLLDGFTQDGIAQLTTVLPEIIKSGTGLLLNNLAFIGLALKDKSKEKDKDDGKFSLGGLIKELKGVAGLAGLAALIFALQTDGPFKGIAKLASRGLLEVSGWTKLIDGFIGKFLKKLIGVPFKLIRNFEKSFAGLVGKEVGGTVIKTGLGKLTGFASRFLAGAMKGLKKVPFVGSLISIGMAFSRFRQGDVVGGGLEVLSGVANAFGLVPLSIAIDGLNAFLDYKAGGTPEGGGKNKGGMLLGWIHDFSNFIYKNFVRKIRMFPIVGPLVKAFDAFKAGQWQRGIKQLAYIFTPFEWIGELLGDQDTTGSGKKLVGVGFKIGDMFKSLTSALMKKVKEWWKSISSGLRMLFEAIIPDDVKKDLGSDKPVVDTQTPTPKEAEAPKATEPTSVVPREGQTPEAKPAVVEPALTTTKISDASQKPVATGEEDQQDTDNAPDITPQQNTTPAVTPETDKTADYMVKLVENSDKTNDTLSNLVVGFNTLATALGKLGVSIAENPGNNSTTIINGKSGGASKVGAASDFAKMGNPVISSFRNLIEQSRQVPS